MKIRLNKVWQQLLLAILSFTIAITFAGCGVQTINQYEATARTTLTWQVNYTNDPMENKQGRYEEFESVSVDNRNGEKPDGRVVGPDEKGLYWATNPPKPTVDDIEARQKKSYEEPGKPEILRQVKYYITYQQDGQTITLPTNYEVYRQVVKAYPNQTPLQLTMGLNNGSVEKAEPI
ncbi:conserved hypothetical protein [Hyella patelloides LEGE 07179]|uniref:Lipoprotein n=1 Tax=Hyella patelloides LEGE 07179 TaxID=945734 RepID=A0A563W4N7_9CYAN|nr:hypothetical protein [Hyella patelloides]VEP18626.1 conserved hypothetical protein [Hyella patelloides LEGE 07179]